MFRADPAIARRDVLSARMFQAMFPLTFRLQYSSSRLQFATKRIAAPFRLTVPTRHGPVRALVYSPTAADVNASSRPPAVHLIAHGGAFIVRVPRQEDNVARYLASELGCYVVIPDYDTAPRVRFPVSEQQLYDVYRWIRDNAADRGWDGTRVSVGGPSAGGKFALSVATQSIDDGVPVPVALTSEYGCADLRLPDSARTSPKEKPVVPPQMMDLVRRTYFKDVDVSDPLASPAAYPRLGELPPTLILTAEYDTLRHEMNGLATDLAAKGVSVTHREFAGVDHGFTHTRPIETAREAITMIGDHLRKAYA